MTNANAQRQADWKARQQAAGRQRTEIWASPKILRQVELAARALDGGLDAVELQPLEILIAALEVERVRLQIEKMRETTP